MPPGQMRVWCKCNTCTRKRERYDPHLGAKLKLNDFFQLTTYSPSVSGFATYDEEEQSMASTRTDVIRARIRELEKELTQRESYGYDDHADGTVLTWVKKFRDSEKDFHYVAIKVDDWWYLTGTKVKGPARWDELVQHWSDGIAVESVLFATGWRPVNEADEADEADAAQEKVPGTA